MIVCWSTLSTLHAVVAIDTLPDRKRTAPTLGAKGLLKRRRCTTAKLIYSAFTSLDGFDEYHLLIAPIIAGSDNPYLPGKIPVKLELFDERRFDNGRLRAGRRPPARPTAVSKL